MRVLLPLTLAQGGKTGVFHYLQSLLEAMRGSEVHFLLAGFREEKHLFSHLLPWASWLDFPGWPGRPALDLALHQCWLNWLAQRQGADLIHIPSYRRTLLFSRVPQVVTVHDLSALQMVEKYGRARNWLARWLFHVHIPRAHRVICVSHATRQQLEALLGPKSPPIATIWNGVRTDSAGSAQHDPGLLYVSRLEHPGKNHLNLISAYELYRQHSEQVAPLTLIGEAWNGAAEIRSRIERSPFATDIRWLGFVPALSDYYQRARALVYPSLAEGFGLPIVEAMASGCPVLCSDIPVFREIAGGAAIYFDPRRPEQMAEALTATRDQVRMQRHRRLGLERAQAFSWQRAAEATLQVYREALS